MEPAQSAAPPRLKEVDPLDRPGPQDAPGRPDATRQNASIKPFKSTDFAAIWSQTGLPDDNQDDLDDEPNDSERPPDKPDRFDGMPRRPPAKWRDGPSSSQAADPPMYDYYKGRRERPTVNDLPNDRPDQDPEFGNRAENRRMEDYYRRLDNHRRSVQRGEIPTGYTMDQIKWLAKQRNVTVEAVVQYLRQKELQRLNEEQASIVAMRQIAANAYERKMESLWTQHNMALRRRYLQNYSNYFQQLRTKARSFPGVFTNPKPSGSDA